MRAQLKRRAQPLRPSAAFTRPPATLLARPYLSAVSKYADPSTAQLLDHRSETAYDAHE
jgi:hypothetical protein